MFTFFLFFFHESTPFLFYTLMRVLSRSHPKPRPHNRAGLLGELTMGQCWCSLIRDAPVWVFCLVFICLNSPGTPLGWAGCRLKCKEKVVFHESYNLKDMSSQTPFINPTFKKELGWKATLFQDFKCFPCSSGSAAPNWPTRIELTYFDLHIKIAQIQHRPHTVLLSLTEIPSPWQPYVQREKDSRIDAYFQELSLFYTCSKC